MKRIWVVIILFVLLFLYSVVVHADGGPRAAVDSQSLHVKIYTYWDTRLNVVCWVTSTRNSSSIYCMRAGLVDMDSFNEKKSLIKQMRNRVPRIIWLNESGK